MAGGQVGLGTATFGSVLVGVFSVTEGFSYDGKQVPAVNCTVDTDAEMSYASGDLPDFGQFVATILVPDGVDLDAIVGTTETLTLTLQGNDTRTGAAILLSAPVTTAPNEATKAVCTFKYTGAVVYAAVV